MALLMKLLVTLILLYNGILAVSSEIDCVLCDSRSDVNCAKNPDLSKTCKIKSENFGSCFVKNECGYITRGCLNVEFYNKFAEDVCDVDPKRCMRCSKSKCNKQVFEKQECIICDGVQCKSEYLKNAVPQTCSNPPVFNTKNTCYTKSFKKDNEIIYERGCYSDLSIEEQHLCEKGNCKLCEGRGCNNKENIGFIEIIPVPPLLNPEFFEQKCLVCDSKTDSNCGTNPDYSKTCTIDMRRGACAITNDCGHIKRYCMNFDENPYDFKLGKVDFTKNYFCAGSIFTPIDFCNNAIYPKLSCLQCSGGNCLENYEDVSAPQKCVKVPPFGSVETCYTKSVAPGVWRRGCFYDLNSDQQDTCEYYDNNCHICYGTGCNYINWSLK
ncbi:hypothetical protein ACFFRR_003205 [Megaselia abdita]